MIRRHARARAQNTTRTRARARERVWSTVAEPGIDPALQPERAAEHRHELSGASDR